MGTVGMWGGEVVTSSEEECGQSNDIGNEVEELTVSVVVEN